MGRTAAERALARSYTTGDGRVGFDVTGLSVEHRSDRSVTLTYRLTVRRQGCQEERWEFTLPWRDKSFADVFTSSAAGPERLRMLVSLVRTLLEEWWDTKEYDRRSAKAGRRCP
ncbi:hypothetical protein V1L54_20030 [Streptomyces sp. TRM 70361]|uniref:hypothetical protein n=1 Tax=Streptomyces sp. TRM 70361 TaxID=3116553 RepID=UPI002E7AE46C|nr:hypothetical protein [Streptomyces sp. TRM 70361]MEE1941671.1 hypothetical protein [Streptomyces sp. TRM 70361]